MFSTMMFVLVHYFLRLYSFFFLSQLYFLLPFPLYIFGQSQCIFSHGLSCFGKVVFQIDQIMLKFYSIYISVRI